MAAFENRSGAYFLYVSSGSAENPHLQAAMATFGSGSDATTYSTRIARKSLTLVRVGPVTTRSPRAAKKS